MNFVGNRKSFQTVKGLFYIQYTSLFVFRQVIFTISVFVFYFEFPTTLLIGYDPILRFSSPWNLLYTSGNNNNNNSKSNFAKHLLDNTRSVGQIEGTRSVLYVMKNGEHMNTLKKFSTYIKTKNNNHINDKSTVICNLLFDAIISHDVCQWRHFELPCNGAILHPPQ